MTGETSTGEPATPTPILILGVGNLLMGDEGVGVHALQRLEKLSWPPGVILLDGGTGGIHLLEPLRGHPRVLLLDATIDGEPDGTVRSFPARKPGDFPAALGAHEFGLRDLLVATALMGPMPEIQVITISVSTLDPMSMALSRDVEEALLKVEGLVRKFVDDWSLTGSVHSVD
jgi:hydrogenase maturation protease